jgi:hypothetical protein
MKSFAIGCVTFLALITVQSASAKDLTNRLGVGYKDQFDSGTAGLAVQYYPGPDLGVSGTLSIDTKKDNSSFGALAKLYRIVFQEDNLNFYMGGGAGLVSQETSGSNSSGFQLLAYTGCEFFLPGLENLGLSFEAGASITSLSSSVRFRTYGDSPIRAGIIFYF